MVTVRSAGHKVHARLAAAALALPLLLGGAAAPIATHAMTPAVGSLSNYEPLGDVQELGAVHLSCQLPGAAMPCYSPTQVRAAYDIQPLLDSGVTGAGQTIVIVDAFSDPLIQHDLARFDTTWQLAPANLDVLYPQGRTPFTPSALQIGWAVEITLDVEWAHVVAPDANLVLVLAKSEQDTDLLKVTEFAIDHQLGDVITMSFGESESCADPALLGAEHAAFERAASRGITLVSASGDFGATNQSCDGSGAALTIPTATTPASDPDVTAIGGTRLIIDPRTGAYVSETGWNDQFGASGGGFSSIYRRPGYQAPFIDDNSARGLPDVAYSADKYGGAIIALGFSPSGFARVSGTSVGTPQWAGIAALSEQAAGHRLPQLNIRLYHLAKSDGYSTGLHDITTGNNTFDGVAGSSAGPGWDPVTGLGTPDVANLVPLLALGVD